MPPERAERVSRGRLVLLGLAPLVLLAALVGLILTTDPGRTVGGDAPPVERLVFGQPRLDARGIHLPALNDGPDTIAIAQVVVDDAYWDFSASEGTSLAHLGRTTLTIPYPWVQGESHTIKVLTSTGAAFERVIPVAVESPEPRGRYFLAFALIGLYVGVIGGIMLGLGRALGETMAVTFVIGNAHRLSPSLLEPGNTIASALANEFTEAVGDLYTAALIELGLILFFITFVVLAMSKLLLYRLAKREGKTT